MKILYVPIDDRPCTLLFPLQLAEIASVEMLTPPMDYLGNFMQKGSPAKIMKWLEVNSANADVAILSLDMLVYGGLVASREVELGFYRENLAKLQEWFEKKGNLKVFAFSSVMRAMPTFKNLELLKNASNLKNLLSKIYDGATSPDMIKMRTELLADLDPNISAILLQSFIAGMRNTEVNLAAVEWLKKGFIDYLLFGMDDILVKSVADFRRGAIRNAIPEKIQGKCKIYTGIDEAAMLLFAKALLEHYKTAPTVRVHFSDQLSNMDTIYEQLPLSTLVADYLELEGLKLVGEDADIEFFCRAFSGDQKEAFTQKLFPTAGAKKFAKEIASFQREHRFVAVADLAYANGADTKFIQALMQYADPVNLISFSAWNTSGNTLGSSLALAIVRYLTILQGGGDLRAETAFHRFLFARFMDDWFYQSILRNSMNLSAGMKRISPLNMSDAESNYFSELISEYMQNYGSKIYSKFYAGNHYINGLEHKIHMHKPIKIEAFLPWNRLFEVAIQVKFDLSIS